MSKRVNATAMTEPMNQDLTESRGGGPPALADDGDALVRGAGWQVVVEAHALGRDVGRELLERALEAIGEAALAGGPALAGAALACDVVGAAARLPVPVPKDTILVVDDCRPIIMVVEVLLKKRFPNLRIEATHDGASGLIAYGRLRDRLALVVTNIHMPVMDGEAMLKAIRRDEEASGEPAPRIIVLSGSLSGARIAREQGAAHVEKGGNPARLLALVADPNKDPDEDG